MVPFGWRTTKSLVEETLVNLDVMRREVSLRMNVDSDFSRRYRSGGTESRNKRSQSDRASLNSEHEMQHGAIADDQSQTGFTKFRLSQ